MEAEQTGDKVKIEISRESQKGTCLGCKKETSIHFVQIEPVFDNMKEITEKDKEQLNQISFNKKIELCPACLEESGIQLPKKSASMFNSCQGCPHS